MLKTLGGVVVLGGWSAGAVVGGSSAVEQRQNVGQRGDTGSAPPPGTILQLRSVVVHATTSRPADGRPTSTTLLSRNIPRLQ